MEQTAIQILIEKYNKQWEKYGMGSSISYSELIADLKQANKLFKNQIVHAWNDGLWGKLREGEDNAESYYNETFKSE